MKLELIATATFGLEAVVRREVEALGYTVVKTEDGKVTFVGDERAIVRANLWLRSADRVLVKMGEFMAYESEDLFQGTKGIDWQYFIPEDGKFTVKAVTVKSELRSEPNCQKTVKKAVVEKMSETYGVKTFPETGARYTIKLNLLKDRATLTMDTSGSGLHKRGYRIENVPAPVKETLAAAMVQLSFWNPDRTLVDPCCGSGTIAIEAAMIGRNIAPGLSRDFASEEWEFIDRSIWKEERKKAFEVIDYNRELSIICGDLEQDAVDAAIENAAEAGVDDAISFSCQDIHRTIFDGDLPDNSVIVTNPPYGERIGDEEGIRHIYREYNRLLKERQDVSLFMLTADDSCEKKVASKMADRRRKLYNGRIQVCYYQFHGKRI